MRPVKDLLFQDLHDYAGMNPEAAKVMGWPDKDHAIELDEHQSEAVRVKNTYYNTQIYKIQEGKYILRLNPLLRLNRLLTNLYRQAILVSG